MLLTLHDKLLRHRALYLWGDSHICHGEPGTRKGAISLGDRPFEDVTDMTDQMIEYIDKLPVNALIISSGDLFMGKDHELQDFLDRCPRQFICVRGNHDPEQRIMTVMKGGKMEHRDQSYYSNKPLTFPHDIKVGDEKWRIWYVDKLMIKGITYTTRDGLGVSRINIDHYPAEEWHGAEKSGILFHGHVHHDDPDDRMKGRLNICVDVLASRYRNEWASIHGKDHLDPDSPVYNRYVAGLKRCFMPQPIEDMISMLEIDREFVKRSPSDRWPSRKS